ncbi:MAG TPA: FxSxx-COOH system tetratricopeptide repeat protein [Ktedonobacteraceae bacterium]|nr:FxSxx-COOH system tetratricopeptide repeat protein [Ktedonobacteraceae bacterium]
MSSSSLSQAIKIFFSYATSSPKDKRLFEKLVTHLSGLRRQHLIDEWYDSAISAGSNLTQVIEAHLRAADIIVLLISAEFLASDRCYKLEMQQALELSTTGTARLIPVILSPTDWEALPLAHYNPLPVGGTPISLKRNIDAALSEVARGIRKVVEELAGQVKRIRTHSVVPKLPLCHCPYRQNAFFTDRETIFSALTSFFTFSQTRQTRMVALHGLGGIGKTQIALEYLYRSSRLYQSILWLNASSRERFHAEVNALADEIALPEKDRTDEDHLFAAVKRWLQSQTNWLLVLDHLDDFTLIDLIVPAQGSGHVLLTTRIQVAWEMAEALPIAQLDTDAGVFFLLQRAEIIPTGASLDQAPPAAIQQATAVVQAMDGFPLALDQAGAYLAETGCGLATYLTLLQQERASLLSRRGRIAGRQNHPDSVTITLSLTIEKVVQQRATNLPLLRLLAFLHPESIPYELLVDGADALHEPLRSLTAHPLALNEALADLHNYSLIYHLADTTTLRIHRIIQAVLIDGLPKGQQRQWASQAVRLVNHVFPEVSFDTQEECERYLPQAQHCATLITNFQLTLKEGALLLQRLGTYCYRHACYSEAEAHLAQALLLQEQHHWAAPQEIAQTLNSLGLLYHRQTRYQEAEKVQLRALELREQALGPTHFQTAESLHNLAVLYGSQGRYQQAEQFYQRVLTLDEQMIGPEHPDTAKTLNNLGLIQSMQGNYTQAETAYQRALAIYEHALAPNHPDLAYPLNGLGDLAEKRGHYQQAEQFYQRALAIREQTLGDTHPETAYSFNKLAGIYEIQGKDQQAEALYQRALVIGEQALGPDHPDVALFLNNLAFLADKQEQYQQAEPLYQRALSIYEQALGADHPTVADVLNNLGVLYRDTHNEARAEQFLQRALAIREQIFGPTHPDTAQSLSNLADLRVAQHAYQEAEALFQQAYTLRLQMFGPAHPDVARTRAKYISLLERMNKNEEAAMLWQATQIQQEQPSADPSQDEH